MMDIYQLEEAKEMRENGETYQEIADKFGVTRQAICLRLNPWRRGEKVYKTIRFKGFYDFFRDNPKKTISQLARYCVMSGGQRVTQRYMNLLTNNPNTRLTIKEIKRMCDYTGKTFEQLFEEMDDIEDGNQKN